MRHSLRRLFQRSAYKRVERALVHRNRRVTALAALDVQRERLNLDRLMKKLVHGVLVRLQPIRLQMGTSDGGSTLF